MKLKIKKVVLIISVMIALHGRIHAIQKLDVDVIKDGEHYADIELILVEKMGYLKPSVIADVFSCGLEKCLEEEKVSFSWDDVLVDFTVGSKYVEIEGIERKMMKTPLEIENQYYVPLEAVITRAFQSASGAKIRWDFSERKLRVSYEGNISDIRNYTYDGYTRLVIETTKPLEYRSDEENGIVYLKIDNGSLAFPDEELIINDDVIDYVGIAEKEAGTVFKVKLGKNAGKHETMKMPGPTRVVLDVQNTDEKSRREKSVSTHTVQEDLRNATQIEDINLVVIDPGHGGRDPGAIGPMGTREKDIALEISKKLAGKIRERLNVRAVLTRTHDYFVPLADRTRIANSKEADIFISIHTNASLNPDARGFEVFFLSEDASDKEAEAVARRENSVMAMEERTKNMDRVSTILWSLTMNQFMNESSELCSFVNSAVIDRTGMVDRGVRQAAFHVMRGARMPAILVEAGFISNREEEKKLNDEDFQKKLASSICDAVEQYRDWIKKR